MQTSLPWESEFWWDDDGKNVEVLLEGGDIVKDGIIEVDVFLDDDLEEHQLGCVRLDDGTRVFNCLWRERRPLNTGPGGSD